MKPRSFHRLAHIWSYVSARERRALDMASKATTDSEWRRWINASERWFALCQSCRTCPRQEAA